MSLYYVFFRCYIVFLMLCAHCVKEGKSCHNAPGIYIVYIISKRGAGHLMEERIKPGMQQAVICSLLTTRDIIEYRKVGFIQVCIIDQL